MLATFFLMLREGLEAAERRILLGGVR